MPSDRSQDKVDSRKELLRLSSTEQPSDTLNISEVTASDLNWLPADHHGADIEDEVAVDPWNFNIEIEEKETLDETTYDALNTAGDDVGTQIDLFSDLKEKCLKTI